MRKRPSGQLKDDRLVPKEAIYRQEIVMLFTLFCLRIRQPMKINYEPGIATFNLLMQVLDRTTNQNGLD